MTLRSHARIHYASVLPGRACVVSITDTRGGAWFHVSAGELQ